MIKLTNIHSLTNFQRNAKSSVVQAKETKAPMVLTVNGRAELVVQDAQAYQELLDRLDKMEANTKPFEEPYYWAAFCAIGQ